MRSFYTVFLLRECWTFSIIHLFCTRHASRLVCVAQPWIPNAAFRVVEPVTIKLPTDLHEPPAGQCTNSQEILRYMQSCLNLSAEKTLSSLTKFVSAMIILTAVSSSHDLKSSRKADWEWSKLQRRVLKNCSAVFLRQLHPTEQSFRVWIVESELRRKQSSEGTGWVINSRNRNILEKRSE